MPTPPTIAPATACSAWPNPLFGYVTAGRYCADLRDAIERGERLLRGRVHECEMRLVHRHVRRDPRARSVAANPRLRAAVRAGERVGGDARDRGDADLIGLQQVRHVAGRRPPDQRIDRLRDRVEIPPEPAGPLRLAEVGRGPDVGPLKMRAAGILVARSLDQCEPARVEDAPKPGQARVQSERRSQPDRCRSGARCPAGIASTGRRA